MQLRQFGCLSLTANANCCKLRLSEGFRQGRLVALQIEFYSFVGVARCVS